MPLKFKYNFCKLHKVTLALTIGFSVACTISCHTCVLQLINTQLLQQVSCGTGPLSNYFILLLSYHLHTTTVRVGEFVLLALISLCFPLASTSHPIVLVLFCAILHFLSFLSCCMPIAMPSSGLAWWLAPK